ncbi:unnamed protein product [Closterium sp. NIES-54]
MPHDASPALSTHTTAARIAARAASSTHSCEQAAHTATAAASARANACARAAVAATPAATAAASAAVVAAVNATFATTRRCSPSPRPAPSRPTPCPAARVRSPTHAAAHEQACAATTDYALGAVISTSNYTCLRHALLPVLHHSPSVPYATRQFLTATDRSPFR